MPNYFDTLANLLLTRTKDTITIKSYTNGDFGFTYRGYKGKMAKQKSGSEKFTRSKQGFFDFLVNTGSRYLTTSNDFAVTHYKLIKDLLKNTTLQNCFAIWRGSSPFTIAQNLDEEQALLTLSLLMFEQEVNWGKECWQKNSKFNPSTVHPYKRPRDMIMGFVIMAFSNPNNITNYPYWNDSNGIPTNISNDSPATPTFGKAGYDQLDPNFKKHFLCLENNNSTLPLMSGNSLLHFSNSANLAQLNPTYKAYHNI